MCSQCCGSDGVGLVHKELLAIFITRQCHREREAQQQAEQQADRITRRGQGLAKLFIGVGPGGGTEAVPEFHDPCTASIS